MFAMAEEVLGVSGHLKPLLTILADHDYWNKEINRRKSKLSKKGKKILGEWLCIFFFFFFFAPVGIVYS